MDKVKILADELYNQKVIDGWKNVSMEDCLKRATDYYRIDEIVKNNDLLHSVSERFLLVQWMDGQPKIDGALYFDTQDECIEYYRSLPVFEEFNITHTICRISNAH